MSEIANIGKTISIFVAGFMYLCVWAWSIDHSKDCIRNATWEVLVSRVFIGLHIDALIVWFIWSWKH